MLSGEVALVTGGSRGIGKAIATALALANAAVVVNSIDEQEAADTAQELNALGKKAVGIRGDVSNSEEVEALVKQVQDIYGKITILINNAGITKDGLLMRMKEEDWDKVLDINLKGTFNCTKACIKDMVKQKKGSIVNISSVVGISGNAGQTNYSASKAGVIGFTKSLAKEVGNRGIRVNAVAPGFIDTDMTGKLPEELVARIKEQIPLGSLGAPEDVADLVMFLVSPAAKYITGEVIKVDGGLNL
ncbi:3-oxoacyl-[acyl-carrier-protein] reductase [Desulfitibacter alkalitolerans]|uniref:3-oxoacyl-[acyl-carrier-protein] reductase n=1 Tax=Desulfitibacter alkalitolerans TaxID=264641 RepID=UPI0004815699|nr:3-oxoacyl-[acyl-carrier-protein] reductase [Desulfitibacter alkalitolerans]